MLELILMSFVSDPESKYGGFAARIRNTSGRLVSEIARLKRMVALIVRGGRFCEKIHLQRCFPKSRPSGIQRRMVHLILGLFDRKATKMFGGSAKHLSNTSGDRTLAHV